MWLSKLSPQTLLRDALGAIRNNKDSFHEALEKIPAPIYVTDAEGIVTYFNAACVDFTGRDPVAGEDRWCVTWRLSTETGEFLPHDMCPMALAIREQKPLRGLIAWAERPDGTRVRFMPCPTPLLDENGVMYGAVNMLVDTTDPKQADIFRAAALRCRRLGLAANDPSATENLLMLAGEYEASATMLDLALARSGQ